MTDLLAIANASAGSATDQSRGEALAVLREERDVTLVTTGGPTELDKALRAHADARTVVALGGDGSLHAVVAALHASGRLGDVEVGLVPLGTGNDFARTLVLPSDPARAAAVVTAGKVKDLDLIVDDAGTVTVNAAHLGVGTDAAQAAQPWKERYGRIGYVAGAAISSIGSEGAHIRVRVDGEPVPDRGRVLQVAVGNGRFVGGGAALLPEADPSDGLLDVTVSFAESRRRKIAYVFSLGLRQHHRLADVDYLRGTEVTVDGRSLRCTNDGEVAEPTASFSWHVEPGALRMLVP